LVLRPAIFDRDVLALDIAGRLEALAKYAQTIAEISGDAEWRTPITGIADCCARAASGHAAAPPTVAKNFRRAM